MEAEDRVMKGAGRENWSSLENRLLSARPNSVAPTLWTSSRRSTETVWEEMYNGGCVKCPLPRSKATCGSIA